jgi:hypothetical protein
MSVIHEDVVGSTPAEGIHHWFLLFNFLLKCVFVSLKPVTGMYIIHDALTELMPLWIMVDQLHLVRHRSSELYEDAVGSTPTEGICMDEMGGFFWGFGFWFLARLHSLQVKPPSLHTYNSRCNKGSIALVDRGRSSWSHAHRQFVNYNVHSDYKNPQLLHHDTCYIP